jgi:alpha-tubulin suppressor-like RCC1 family protein
MSTGGFYGCGVTTSDTAYCWGQNNDGDLGTGLTSNSTTPLPVAGGLSFAAISASLGTYSYAGGSHSRTCALTNAGTAYCWGDNFDGELGTSDTVHRTTPAAVSGGLTFGTVTAGGFHSCGLTTAGAAYCWGDNTYGQLGRGDTISSTIPVAVSGGLTFAALRAGGLFTCGVAVAGAAYCWGDNRDGELGTGDTIRSVSPVAVSGGLTFSSVSPGRNHACALTITGAAYCWGSNDNAKLGNGEYGLAGYSLVPRAVAGGLTFVAVSAGGYLSCAVTSTGAAYCWGDNIDGELGNGGGSSSAVPVRVVH